LEDNVTLGFSLLLIAVGAILTWAVSATVSGVNIHTVGVILMVVGAVGLVLSLFFWRGGPWGARRTTVVGRGTGDRVVQDDYVETP
jgi:hypothetical protein